MKRTLKISAHAAVGLQGVTRRQQPPTDPRTRVSQSVMARSMRAAAAGLLCAVALQALAFVPRVDCQASEETVLAESDFLWDVDGWTTRGSAENFQHGQKMIKASDSGPDTWFFVAPGKFLGAKRAAYGGKLSFRHGFFEYNRCAAPHSTPRAPVRTH